MAVETKQVKFTLIPLDELCKDVVNIVDDNTYKLKRAKSPMSKRQLQRTQDLLCSMSFHLEALKKIQNDSN